VFGRAEGGFRDQLAVSYKGNKGILFLFLALLAQTKQKTNCKKHFKKNISLAFVVSG
jgi:hypothetical protein